MTGRFEPGTIIDGVVVLDEYLGDGDFAEVYRGHLDADPDGDALAIKITSTTRPKDQERFEIEIACLQAIDQPGVPKLHVSGSAFGYPYFAMDLAPGRTLEKGMEERDTPFSDIAALEILVRLLRILERLHGDGWVHRDIKPANVMVSDSGSTVTLIDFGFCKEDGRDDRRVDDSFFRAGASRFSPPTKHEYPTRARASHDVFAVGVIAYLMVTGSYPWTAPGGDDGDLLDQMRAARPRRPRDRNNQIRPEVERFVESLLNTDDATRPTTEEARKAAERALATLSGPDPSIDDDTSVVSFRRVWRDELYGDVRLTDYEMALIDTFEMQRLRRIRQLGLTHYAYGSADHNRLAHSVGTLFRTDQILTTMSEVEGLRVEPESRLVARAYALIHDVVHIPFGHTLEDEFAFFTRHDENLDRIQRLVLSEESELGARLRQNEVGRQVRTLFDPAATIHSRSAIKDLVAGALGADLLDYIDRDSYNLGLEHRIDSAIFRQFRIHRPASAAQQERIVSLLGGAYGIRVDRQLAIRTVLLERYALFLKAYSHRSKIKASCLLGKAMALSLKDTPLFTEVEIEGMSDDGLLARLEMIPHNQRAHVSETIKRLLRRQLPVAVYRAALLQDGQRDPESYKVQQFAIEEDRTRFGLFPFTQRLAVERELARCHSELKAEEVFVYASRSAPGYRRTQLLYSVSAPGEIPEAVAGSWLEDLHRDHLELWDLWVFASPDVSPDARARLAREAGERFGLKNEIGPSGSRQALT